MLSTFLLLRPHYLLLALPLLAVFLLAWLKPKQSSNWESIIDKPLLDFLLPHTQSSNKRRLLIAIISAWGIALLALIGPSLTQSLVPQHKKLYPRIILLDLSGNMMKQDLLPNRLDRAKFKIRDLLDIAKESETSLVAFTEEPFMVTPFTEDKQTLLNLLQRLNPSLMPIDGHNIEKALNYSKKLFEKNNMHTGEVLLVTSSIPNQADYDAAATLASAGYKTSVLGIGEKQNLANRAYQSLVQSGLGLYRAHDIQNTDLQDLLKSNVTKHTVEKQQHGYQPHDDGYYLVFILMVLVLLGFRRGILEQIVRA